MEEKYTNDEVWDAQLLHCVHIIHAMFDRHLLDDERMKQHKECYDLVQQISDLLGQLYQKTGAL